MISGSFFSRQTSPVIVKYPFLIAGHNPCEKRIAGIAQKMGRRSLKTTIFLTFAQFSFLAFPVCSKWRRTVMQSTTRSAAISRVVLRRSTSTDVFNGSLSTTAMWFVLRAGVAGTKLWETVLYCAFVNTSLAPYSLMFRAVWAEVRPG